MICKEQDMVDGRCETTRGERGIERGGHRTTGGEQETDGGSCKTTRGGGRMTCWIKKIGGRALKMVRREEKTVGGK
jgi:hypothetical protein